jgi:hypothetical protein
MPSSADEARREFVTRLGLDVKHTQELGDRLLGALDSDMGGLPFFADLPLVARAIASDQVVGAARAIDANLVEARLHERNHHSLAESGFGLPTTLDDHERAACIGSETVAFFRAIGSTLDCLAAVMVGLLRIPVSIRRASFTQVLKLDPDKADSEDVRELWSGLRELVDRAGNDPPDWIAWTLEMRHALMHRARLLTVLVARETKMPPLALPSHVRSQVAMERLRADYHFRARPWLPDMQHLADGGAEITDAILREPETVTIKGIATATNTLTEDCCEWLLVEWATIEKLVNSPLKAWRVEESDAITFRGFVPDHPMPDMTSMMISPRDEERIRLAALVRDSGLKA